ncbi:MAG TPA: PEP-CTERM sorting domain-containing protein [Candidatus Acidoferrum sp.]|nr:PEP-CTERM sorting domain-containing protein [Candidatus Acidoferrum sp.]
MGVPDNLLVASGRTTTVRTENASGLNVVITDTLENIPLDAPAATLEVVAWDDVSGQYPTWAITVYNIGGDVNVPPVFSFNALNLYYVPEPAAFALAGLGAGLILNRRKRS